MNDPIKAEPRRQPPGWWKTIRASAVGSLVGFVVGAIAGLVLVLVTHAAGSSDGTGGAALVIPVFFGVIGFVLGFATPLFWHGWHGGNRRLVLFILVWASLLGTIFVFGTTHLTVLILLAIGAAISIAIQKLVSR